MSAWVFLVLIFVSGGVVVALILFLFLKLVTLLFPSVFNKDAGIAVDYDISFKSHRRGGALSVTNRKMRDPQEQAKYFARLKGKDVD